MSTNQRPNIGPNSLAILACAAGLALAPSPALAQPAPGGPGSGEAKPDFPPFEKVIEGLSKVVSTSDGAAPLYDLYRDEKTGRLLAVLSKDFESKLIMIACTVTAGDPQAGVMGPTHYAKWERYDKQLALVVPNLFVRTSGDAEARSSVESLYTGRVLLSTPILAMAPGDRPVIDLGGIATRDASKLFGGSAFGGYGPNLYAINPALSKLTKAKAFPKNVVVEYQAPRPDGRIIRLAYSIGDCSGTEGFKPRKTDSRLGYFYDWHQDFAKVASEDVTERYITRWSLEKADPKLKLSPPKQPIVWYIEHTTPVRFRRYVREGIEMWNDAFREVGIDGAVVVYQQDAATGAHMDKDPEDARYNFFRWNTSDQAYAIGPSRSNPLTGEILDADVVWHQGLTRSVRNMLENFADGLAEHAFNPETLAWLEENPTWDPRVRLAQPLKREAILRERALRDAAKTDDSGTPRPRAHWALEAMNKGSVPAGKVAGVNGAACQIGSLLALDLSLAHAAFATDLLENTGEDLLDGLPEEFIGQMIRYISAHEVGHCLGLEHNMIASTIRSPKEINTNGFSGPIVGSVMEYAAVNINHNLGEVQGPYAATELGPYDKWVIAYGYGPEDTLGDVVKRVAEPDLIYQAQLAIAFGADPRNNTWDLGADNLEFAKSRLDLVQSVRGKLIDTVVKDGEPWAVARRRYEALLGTHLQMLSIASRWVGGSFLNNDYKGDPAARTPVEDVPADRQRLAMRMIIDNAFRDEAFGLTPELVRHFGKQHYYDDDALDELFQESSYTVHDMVGGAQSFALTMLMNPVTLRRVYDNEFRSTDQKNPFTLVELVTTVTDSCWSECASPARGSFTDQKPMISSFRRNLQREHTERLITLSLLRDNGSATLRAISTLARAELKRIDGMCEKALGASPDAYTRAHLEDVRTRIARALDAAYVVTR